MFFIKNIQLFSVHLISCSGMCSCFFFFFVPIELQHGGWRQLSYLQSLDLHTRKQNWDWHMTVINPLNLTWSFRILAAQYEILSSLNINLYTKTSNKFFPPYLLFSLSIHSFIPFTSIYWGATMCQKYNWYFEYKDNKIQSCVQDAQSLFREVDKQRNKGLCNEF